MVALFDNADVVFEPFARSCVADGALATFRIRGHFSVDRPGATIATVCGIGVEEALEVFGFDPELSELRFMALNVKVAEILSLAASGKAESERDHRAFERHEQSSMTRLRAKFFLM
jgi:hypothetical protein